ncbi:hypothetical protein HYS54_00290 [Candidatus Micrarchaeota archaeon]|nr:hypothetical protein [Candidatus Micrarchaeota archaeon]
MTKEDAEKLVSVPILFTLFAVAFWLVTQYGPEFGIVASTLIWPALLVGTFSWFSYEVGKHRTRLVYVLKALLLGAFLVVFDFAVENAGAILGFWTVKQSALHVMAVPVEVMILIFFGAAAWAMHVPEKRNWLYMLFDSLNFGFFGALGEFILLQNQMMEYSNGWTSMHAFAGYFVTWLILFALWWLVLNYKSSRNPKKYTYDK